MTLILVTPPTSAPISLDEARAHLRVTGGEEDALIASLISAATAHLDGWKGILGRAIMPQTWAQEFRGEVAPFLIAMPDATISSVTADGAAVTTFTTAESPVGMLVDDVAGDLVRVQFTCALPAAQLGLVKVAILLMVGHWFWNREAVGDQLYAVPLAYDAIVEPLRWGRL